MPRLLTKHNNFTSESSSRSTSSSGRFFFFPFFVLILLFDCVDNCPRDMLLPAVKRCNNYVHTHTHKPAHVDPLVTAINQRATTGFTRPNDGTAKLRLKMKSKANGRVLEMLRYVRSQTHANMEVHSHRKEPVSVSLFTKSYAA